LTRAAKIILSMRLLEAGFAIAKAHTSCSFLRTRPPSSPARTSRRTVYVLVPLLREQARVTGLLDRWEKLVAAHSELSLVVLTTAREQAESEDGEHGTLQALRVDGRLEAWTLAGRALHLHYPDFNRTYGEQVSWGVQQIRARCTPQDYVLLVNADSRIDADGMRELLACVAEGTECIQQSAVFLANFTQLEPLPAAEALLQSTWTIETELFRYLAGSGAVRWLPRRLASVWYQHTVGHGLLISVGLLDRIGGFPSPTVGLEDSALGYVIRSQHRSVQPLRRLELADAPSSLRSLLRQRATWVHGPLGALGYRPESSRERLLVAQALYDGGKWALTLPAICVEILLLDRRGRLLWALLFFARRYITLTLMLRSLPRFSGYGLEELPARKLAAAVSLYPVAVLSYGAGGLRGALEMLSEWVTGNPRIQPRTDD
jgi:hypothetical protein